MINAELLSDIDAEFETAIKGNKKIKALYKKIRDGTANFENAQEMAIETGKALSKSFGKHITVDILPDGKMTFQIANEVVRPEIVKGYDYTSSYFNKVQEGFYKSRNLQIKGAPPDLNDDRIKGFVDKLTSAEYEAVAWVLNDPAYLINYLESVVDTGIKNNVGLLGQAGVRSTIKREVDAGACPWCMNLAGEYEYGEQPDDVFRRHRDCHCKVTFDVGKGFRQDVYSKNWFKGDGNWELEKKERFEWSEKYEQYVKTKNVNKRYVPRSKLTPKEAEQLQEILMNL